MAGEPGRLASEMLAALAGVRTRREELARDEAALRQVEVDAVIDGRRERLSWEEIGGALGMTKQAAQQRFGLLCQLADSRMAAAAYQPPEVTAPRPRRAPGAGGRQQPKTKRGRRR